MQYLISFGMTALLFSPTVAGMLWRATMSVWFVWLGWMEPETYMNFSTHFHW